MKARSRIGRVLVAATVAGFITLTSIPGGLAHADWGTDAADYVVWRKSHFVAPAEASSPSVSEIVITKVRDTASPQFSAHELDGINFTCQQIELDS